MKDYIEERAADIANYIINHHAAVRQTAKKFGGLKPAVRTVATKWRCSGCVEICFSNGSVFALDCAAVENGIETTVNRYSELDWLIYNAPLDYVKLVLSREWADT